MSCDKNVNKGKFRSAFFKPLRRSAISPQHQIRIQTIDKSSVVLALYTLFELIVIPKQSIFSDFAYEAGSLNLETHRAAIVSSLKRLKQILNGS